MFLNYISSTMTDLIEEMEITWFLEHTSPSNQSFSEFDNYSNKLYF